MWLVLLAAARHMQPSNPADGVMVKKDQEDASVILRLAIHRRCVKREAKSGVDVGVLRSGCV